MIFSGAACAILRHLSLACRDRAEFVGTPAWRVVLQTAASPAALAGRAPNPDYRKHGGIAAIASQRPAAGTHKFTAGVHGGRFNSVRDTDA